jgi:murein DD-endopeptidase MepM/ murein hydrolase activator NlpD
VDSEYFSILVFGQNASKSRHLKIRKRTLRIGCYLCAFAFLSGTFFLCDYVQVKRKAFELSRLREEAESQRSQIHFFSARIESLEKQLSKLKELDNKIRIIANLEKGQEPAGFVGMGGPSPSDIRDSLKAAKDERGLVRQMKVDLERLQVESESQEGSLSELEKLLQGKKAMLAHTPSIWPTLGWVTSGFGFRTNPFTGLTQMHEGMDISNRIGTPVITSADGVVSGITNDWAYGKTMVISHGFGMVTRYSHLNKALVKVGQKVKRGDKIAEVGATGKTTGPHLHYEVRLNGVPVNPKRYILN